MQSDFNSSSESGLLTGLEVLFEETVDLANYLKCKARRTHQGEQISASGRILLQSLQLHGQQTVPALAHMRSTSRQNIQVLVDRLEAGGFIEFIPNPGHRRSDYVQLTAAGRVMLATANQREASLLETLLPHTSKAEVDNAAKLLRKLRLLMGGERKRRKSGPKPDLKLVQPEEPKPIRVVSLFEEELPVSLL